MAGERVYNAGHQSTERIQGGEKDVASAGTPEALASSTPCYKVLIQAKRANTGRIYIGGSDVANDDSNGIVLNPYDAIEINTQDLSKIYVDSTVNGEGVTFIYWQEYRATVPGNTY